MLPAFAAGGSRASCNMTKAFNIGQLRLKAKETKFAPNYPLLQCVRWRPFVNLLCSLAPRRCACPIIGLEAGRARASFLGGRYPLRLCPARRPLAAV